MPEAKLVGDDLERIARFHELAAGGLQPRLVDFVMQ